MISDCRRVETPCRGCFLAEPIRTSFIQLRARLGKIELGLCLSMDSIADMPPRDEVLGGKNRKTREEVEGGVDEVESVLDADDGGIRREPRDNGVSVRHDASRN